MKLFFLTFSFFIIFNSIQSQVDTLNTKKLDELTESRVAETPKSTLSLVSCCLINLLMKPSQ